MVTWLHTCPNSHNYAPETVNLTICELKNLYYGIKSFLENLNESGACMRSGGRGGHKIVFLGGPTQNHPHWWVESKALSLGAGEEETQELRGHQWYLLPGWVIFNFCTLKFWPLFFSFLPPPAWLPWDTSFRWYKQPWNNEIWRNSSSRVTQCRKLYSCNSRLKFSLYIFYKNV